MAPDLYPDSLIEQFFYACKQENLKAVINFVQSYPGIVTTKMKIKKFIYCGPTVKEVTIFQYLNSYVLQQCSIRLIAYLLECGAETIRAFVVPLSMQKSYDSDFVAEWYSSRSPATAAAHLMMAGVFNDVQFVRFINARLHSDDLRQYLDPQKRASIVEQLEKAEQYRRYIREYPVRRTAMLLALLKRQVPENPISNIPPELLEQITG